MNLNTLYDYLERPEEARIAIARRPPLGLALLGFLIGGMSLALWEVEGGGSLATFCFSAGFFFLWEMSVSFLLAATIELFISIKEPSAGENKNRAGASLFVYFGLAAFVWALAVPAAIFSSVSSWAHGPAAAAMAALAFVNLALKARGVQWTHGFSRFQAWAALLIPCIAAALVIICLFALGAGGLFLG